MAAKAVEGTMPSPRPPLPSPHPSTTNVAASALTKPSPQEPRSLHSSPSSSRRPSLNAMAGPSRSRTSRDSMGDVFADDAETVSRSPTVSRRPSGKLASFIDRLKPTRVGGGGSGAHGHGDEGDGSDDVSPRKSGIHRRKSSSSRLPSGKHTPSDVEGDYGHFLKAAELRDRLEKERIKEAEDELALAKMKRKRGGGGAAKGSELAKKVKAKAEDGIVEPRETLEAKKEMPGAFDDLGLPTQSKKHSTHASPSATRDSRPTADSKPSYFGICGTDISDSEGEERGGDDGGEGARSPTLLHDGFAPEASTPSQPTTHDTPALDRSSSSSSISSSASILDEPLLRQGPGKSASTKSLKSWRSTDSPGTQSLASGGANHKLSAPLLELEELELKSFLKNFNRHTREVRVPASLHFPRRRMPQWEDFRVPPDEAAVAAREGKRVTVLTHVDRGLQALARKEGAGVPPPRDVAASKTSPKKGGREEQQTASEGPHVKWSPETGFVPRGLSTGLPDKEEEMPLFGGSFGRRSLTEKDERIAKQAEKHKDEGKQPPSQQASLGGKGPVAPLKSSPSDHVDNIHDSQVEFHADPQALGATDGVWELIDGAGEMEATVDPHEGERVDGVAFCIAYILALVERYAPEELDNTTDQTYREGRARSHLERLYLIAPFWERLGFGIRRLYRWDNPRRTATAAMIYFVLWWTDLLPTAFCLTIMYYILQFRFFPPEASYLHEQVRARMSRGVEADRLAERLRRRSRLDILEIYKRFAAKYGFAVQLAAGDIADFHEKVKNLILWRNPQATWRTFTLFAVLTVLVTFVPAYYVWKLWFFFLGFSFFCLLPLQSHYPRYRRPLSPVWWSLWGSPTDAQFAIQLLRRRQLERAQSAGPSRTTKNKTRRSDAAHAVKGGAMRPINEEEDTLWGLEEEVSTGRDGEKQFKPKKLGQFFCQHRGVPGHLTVTTRHIYFRGLGQHKSCKTPLEDIAGLAKTKSLQLFVWNSPGLQIARTHKSSLFFSNVLHRDELFNLILAVGSEIWAKV